MPLLKSSIPEIQDLPEAERTRVIGEAVNGRPTSLAVVPGVVAVVYASIARYAAHKLPTLGPQWLDSLVSVALETAVIMGGAALLRRVFVICLRRAVRRVHTSGG